VGNHLGNNYQQGQQARGLPGGSGAATPGEGLERSQKRDGGKTLARQKQARVKSENLEKEGVRRTRLGKKKINHLKYRKQSRGILGRNHAD